MRTVWLTILFSVSLVTVGCLEGDDDVGDDDAAPGDDDDAGDDDAADDDSGPWEDPVVLLDSYDGPSFAELLEVAVWGDWIAFCSGVQGLNLYDATDPADLKFLDKTGFDDGSGQYPRCQHVAVDDSGQRIYVASHADAIQPQSFIAVIDASEPTVLTQVGAYPRPEQVEGLTVAGDLLLVAAHDEGLLVFERGPGGELTQVDQLHGLGNAWTVRAAGDRAYVADGNGGLSVVDLTAPALQRLHSLELPGATKAIALDGDRAYVALGSAGVGLLSLDDPDDPVLIEVEDTPGSALAVAHGAGAQGVYVADWNDIRVFDASDRDDLRLIGREPLPIASSTDSRTLGIAARDDVLFSANWTAMVSYRYRPGIEAPDLVISPSPLNLPSTEAGSQGTALLTLANHGSQPLTLDGLEISHAELTSSALPAGLPVGDETTLTMTFAPTGDGTFVAEVAVTSDDPDQGEQSIAARGNGGGLGIGDALPPMSFNGLDGTVYSTTSMLGGVILLDYFATF